MTIIDTPESDADWEHISNFDSGPADSAVEAARADLESAVADWPVTKALTAYIVATARREQVYCDLLAAQGRVGMEMTTFPPYLAPEPLHNLVMNVAGYAAQVELEEH